MPYSNDTKPSMDGISAGLNQLSEEIYVGLGSFKQQTSPAGLIISGENLGLLFPYGKNVLHLKSNLKYYVKESDCEYKWVTSSHGAAVYQAISVLSPPYTFYVGRVFSFDAHHLGSVNLQHRVMYYAFNETTKTSTSYEVLTCNRRYTTAIPRQHSYPSSNWRGNTVELRAELNEMKEDLKTLKKQINELKDSITGNLQANSTVEGNL